MKRRNLFILLLISLLALSACSDTEDVAGTTSPVTEVTTVPTAPPTVDIGGTELLLDTTDIDLTVMAYEYDALLAASDSLTSVAQIELGTTDLTREQIAAIREQYPDASVSYSVSLLGEVVEDETTSLDLSAMTADQTGELLQAIPMLPALEEINFVNQEGVCVYGIEDIPNLDMIREAAPQVRLHVSFDLFGQTVTSEDERIEYYLVPIGNEGVETVRAVLPYLSACTYFLMDGCDVDNEVMAQLRDDFPETKVVWRIWLTTPYYASSTRMRAASFLTDTHRIRTTYINDTNCHLLQYCTETKYLDIGHVKKLTDCSFLAYMPDLEVAILAITGIRDISPLANHEKLEYLELFTTGIADLTPLASCTNLQHLNISNMRNVTDISPLYGLTNLKRLRMVWCKKVPKEQKEEIAQLLPNCEILSAGSDPTGNGWRYDEDDNKVERYKLLCEQMEYAIDAEYGIP